MPWNRWWNKPADGTGHTKRQHKRDNAVVHSCSLCEHLHERTRKAHGSRTDAVRAENSFNLKYSRFHVVVRDLIAFEAGMEAHSKASHLYDQHKGWRPKFDN